MANRCDGCDVLEPHIVPLPGGDKVRLCWRCAYAVKEYVEALLASSPNLAAERKGRDATLPPLEAACVEFVEVLNNRSASDVVYESKRNHLVASVIRHGIELMASESEAD